MANLRGRFAELRRRNVLRAAALYVGSTWALAQGIAQLGPPLGMPEWVTRWFVAACAIGFPFWVAFAWFYELTPEGLKRESDIPPETSVSRRASRKLDYWIIGVLAIAVVLLATNQFVLRRDATGHVDRADAKAFAAALAKVPAQSVAVLPLANESGDPAQDYFSDGLSEQLISDLTQIDGLKVIGKSSSFQFRDGKAGLAEIGARLGVANLIEGSVRQRGKRLRVVVNLIRASDGASVWSHTYDQPLEDVFAIQSQIGDAVASALKIKLVGTAPDAGEKPPSGNVAAYQALLQGRALARHFTEENMRRAIALERKAIELDPHYAYAWAVLSNSLSNLSVLVNGDNERMRALADARAAADKAMELAPGMAAAHRARSSVLQNDGDLAGALSESRRALELAPNDGNSMTFFANALGSAGQTGQAETLYRKALATDPLRVDWHLNLANVLIRLDRLDEAEQALHAAAALRADYPGLHQFLTTLRVLRGDAAGALHEARQETEANQEFPVAEALQAGSDRKKADAALHGFIARHQADDPYSIAILFAMRSDPDRMFEWLERGWSARETVGVWSMYDNAFMLRYKGDPRFAAYCRKIGVPAPDELTADAFDAG